MELVRYENEKLIVDEEFTKEYANFQKQVVKMELEVKKVKEALKNKMEEYGLTGYEDEFIKVSYRKATQRATVDSKRLKEELPDVYIEYSKVSDVSSSVSIEAKI